MVLSTVTHAQTSVHMHVLIILQNQIYIYLCLQGIARLPPPLPFFFLEKSNVYANLLRHKCIGVPDARP